MVAQGSAARAWSTTRGAIDSPESLAARVAAIRGGICSRWRASFSGWTRWLASRSPSAIWPRTRRSAIAGAGKIAGRCSTAASTRVNSAFWTGWGATTFTGPCIFSSVIAVRRICTASSSAIQDIHCLPLPRRPPTPSLKGVSIRGSAPPCVASTTPKRAITVRTPRAAARAASLSQARQRIARKSLP